MHTRQQKERAKSVVLYLLSICGGQVGDLDELSRAFYFAHMKFSRENAGYLSTWPIMRTDRGVRIGNWSLLVGELLADDAVLIEEREGGGFQIRLNQNSNCPADLPNQAQESIQVGHQLARAEHAASLIRKSRAWGSAADGREMNIYVDTIDDDDFSQLSAEADRAAKLLTEIWSK